MSNTLRDDYIDPVAFGPKQLVSSSKLVRNLSAYIDQTKKRPIFITRDQEVEAVLISLDEYRELLEEEMKVEDLYFTVLAVRRLVEHSQAKEKLMDADEVLEKFGITREEIMGVEAEREVES